MKTILLILLAYLLGSIPWGLIIGKAFFNKDIRNFGSGNLGGTNAGRVLGKPIGLIVILLDSLKAFIFMIICNNIYPEITPYCGLAVCFGHCFPIFANFRGGKAVATAYGYLLGLAIFVTKDIFTFFIPLIIFLAIFLITNYVSLSSMISILSASIYLMFTNFKIGLLVLILALFIIYRHSSNIKKLINKTESKIYLFK